MAVLDQMMNPHWPYLPKRKERYTTQEEMDGIEGVWNTISEDPLNFYFYFLILDGDECGQPPKVTLSGEHEESNNKHFNWGNKSCLSRIAKSSNKVHVKLVHMRYFLLFLDELPDLKETLSS